MDYDVEADGSKRVLSFGDAARETNRDHVHKQVGVLACTGVCCTVKCHGLRFKGGWRRAEGKGESIMFTVRVAHPPPPPPPPPSRLCQAVEAFEMERDRYSDEDDEAFEQQQMEAAIHVR